MSVIGCSRAGYARLGLGIALLFLFSSLKAVASEEACQVFECLTAPSSAVLQQKCPIKTEAWLEDLKQGKALSTCKSSESDTAYFVQYLYAPYDECPAGTFPATLAAAIVQGIPDKQSPTAYSLTGTPAISQPNYLDQQAIGPRACVAHYLGKYWNNASSSHFPIYVYQEVIWQAPQNPRVVDIYKGEKFLKRIRW